MTPHNVRGTSSTYVEVEVNVGEIDVGEIEGEAGGFRVRGGGSAREVDLAFREREGLTVAAQGRGWSRSVKVARLATSPLP